MSKAKLILGTANMGVKPYGSMTEQMSLNEINRIIDYARANGIKTLESSEAYLCDPVLSLKFDLIYKVTHPYSIDTIKQNLGRDRFLGLLYHHGYKTRAVDMRHHSGVDYVGSSVYNAGQISPNDEMIEVPLNLDNREFEKVTAPCKLVRSVFGRGELLKKYTIKECLDFVKNNPTVHGVVIGVDNVAQLAEIVSVWNA